MPTNPATAAPAPFATTPRTWLTLDCGCCPILPGAFEADDATECGDCGTASRILTATPVLLAL
jgi:hypothetical protein